MNGVRQIWVERERGSEIGRARTYWAGTVAFDGQALWVAEQKFSNRIVRFTPLP